MAGAGDNAAAGQGRGDGHLRAAYSDREQVIGTLKDAFVQGRLTQDELDIRVGLGLAARTYADLAALTADLPAGPAAAESAAEPATGPAGSPVRTLAKAARRSGMCILVAFALVGVAALAQLGTPLAALALFSALVAGMAAAGFLGYGIADAWQQRRSRRQLPPHLHPSAEYPV